MGRNLLAHSLTVVLIGVAVTCPLEARRLDKLTDRGGASCRPRLGARVRHEQWREITTRSSTTLSLGSEPGGSARDRRRTASHAPLTKPSNAVWRADVRLEVRVGELGGASVARAELGNRPSDNRPGAGEVRPLRRSCYDLVMPARRRTPGGTPAARQAA